MNAEIERLAKAINKKIKELENFDEKKEGSSAMMDLSSEITDLKKILANKVLSFYR